VFYLQVRVSETEVIGVAINLVMFPIVLVACSAAGRRRRPTPA